MTKPPIHPSLIAVDNDGNGMLQDALGQIIDLVVDALTPDAIIALTPGCSADVRLALTTAAIVNVALTIACSADHDVALQTLRMVQGSVADTIDHKDDATTGHVLSVGVIGRVQ